MKLKIKKIVPAALCLLMAAAVILATIFYPQPRSETTPEKKVVRVWNIDTFEGGKGSRTSFLKNAARRAEKKQTNVFYLVSSYTLEGAKAAFEEGRFPDVLSFGIGLSEFLERSLPLPYSFAGGNVGGQTLAYPWCRGGYALFSLTDDFTEDGSVAISVGGNNLPQMAAALSGIDGEELPSVSAYTRFLSGDFRYLLGTQRDLCRFQTRGVDVYYQPLSNYCDLYQYLSLLSPATETEGLALLEELLSAPEKLQEIGMFPVDADEGFSQKPIKTLGVFTSDETILGLQESLGRKDEKIPENFLKMI